eukprot:14749550-Alexandrium_andersonii.AAC.1
MRRYIGALGEDFRVELQNTETAPEDLLMRDMGEASKKRARSLAYILTMTTEGRALHKVSASLEPDNGYFIWRRFLEEWEPK